MKILKVELTEYENTPAVDFTVEIDGKEYKSCEWLNLTFEEDTYVTEKTDSNFKMYGFLSDTQPNYDAYEILVLVDQELEAFSVLTKNV